MAHLQYLWGCLGNGHAPAVPSRAGDLLGSERKQVQVAHPGPRQQSQLGNKFFSNPRWKALPLTQHGTCLFPWKLTRL